MRQHTSLPFTDLSIEPFNTEWNGTDGNFDKERGVIKGIVWHTMQGFMAGTLSTFRNRKSIAAANYGVSQKGEIVMYVREDWTAYANSNLAYNRSYISIETEDLGDPNSIRPDDLYEACAKLLLDLHNEYGIPLDRGGNLLHREIPNPKDPTKTIAKSCPGTLDVDRIIRRAKELANPLSGSEVKLDNDSANALSVLQEAFTKLKTRDGQPFGNYEGMARELVQIYPDYINLQANYIDTKNKFIVEPSVFEGLAAKAKNFKLVASIFGFSDEVQEKPETGTYIYNQIKEMQGKISMPIFATSSTPLPDTLNSDNANTSTTEKSKPLLLQDLDVVWKAFAAKYLKWGAK